MRRAERLLAAFSHPYLKDTGLDPGEIAVLTSDPERNGLGLPKEDHGSARVLFTTHQMIERRTRHCTFAEAKEFHFEGGPRALRIWDESLIPARHLVIKGYDVAHLLRPIYQKAPEYAEAAQTLAHKIWGSKTGDSVTIPKIFESLPGGMSASKDPIAFETLEALAGLAGQTLGAIQAGTDAHLAGTGTTFCRPSRGLLSGKADTAVPASVRPMWSLQRTLAW